MDIADEFKKVCFFLTNKGLVAILKKMAGAFMRIIKVDRIAGKEPSHEGAQIDFTGAQQEMKVIWNKSPGKTVCCRFFQQGRKTLSEHCSVIV